MCSDSSKLRLSPKFQSGTELIESTSTIPVLVENETSILSASSFGANSLPVSPSVSVVNETVVELQSNAEASLSSLLPSSHSLEMENAEVLQSDVMPTLSSESPTTNSDIENTQTVLTNGDPILTDDAASPVPTDSTMSLPSSASIESPRNSSVFPRHRPNKKFRTAYTDILRNIGSERHVALPGEFRFNQYHTIRYYEGSHLDLVPRNRSALPVTNKFDISIISQTTFGLEFVLIVGRSDSSFFLIC